MEIAYLLNERYGVIMRLQDSLFLAEVGEEDIENIQPLLKCDPPVDNCVTEYDLYIVIIESQNENGECDLVELAKIRTSLLLSSLMKDDVLRKSVFEIVQYVAPLYEIQYRYFNVN